MRRVFLILLMLLVPSQPHSNVNGTPSTSSTPQVFQSTNQVDRFTNAPSSSQSPLFIKLGNFTLDSRKSFRVPQFTTSASGTDSTTSYHSKTAISPTVPLAIQINQTPPKYHFSYHADRRFGPTFEGEGNFSKITVQLGENADLNCRISLLQDKTVSWIRRRTGRPPELLTVGTAVYAADERISLAKRYIGNWKLQILKVRPDDEGVYECQISTHPPRVISIYLHVNSPIVWIADESGSRLQEVYYKTDSNLVLLCRARYVDTPVSLTWLHESYVLNEDITRGGVSVRTEQVENGANSTLKLAHVNASDAGNYTCAVKGTALTPRTSTVTVHVLNEESLAELHANGIQVKSSIRTLPIVISFLIQNQFFEIRTAILFLITSYLLFSQECIYFISFGFIDVLYALLYQAHVSVIIIVKMFIFY